MPAARMAACWAPARAAGPHVECPAAEPHAECQGNPLATPGVEWHQTRLCAFWQLAPTITSCGVQERRVRLHTDPVGSRGRLAKTTDRFLHYIPYVSAGKAPVPRRKRRPKRTIHLPRAIARQAPANAPRTTSRPPPTRVFSTEHSHGRQLRLAARYHISPTLTPRPTPADYDPWPQRCRADSPSCQPAVAQIALAASHPAPDCISARI